MKLASFKIGNSSTWGVIEGEEALDVGAVLRDRYPDLKSAIAADALPPCATPCARQGPPPPPTSAGCRSFPIRTRFSASA